jgi:hypothetical protein
LPPKDSKEFYMKLTKDSPVVLALSQLDSSYFRGLEGQYEFTLNFQVCGVQDPEVHTASYQVLSNARTTSVELPNMQAGCYRIDVSVTAHRDVKKFSVENIVKGFCKTRRQNEKLLSVLKSYDKAYSVVAAEYIADCEVKARLIRQIRRSELRERNTLLKRLKNMATDDALSLPEDREALYSGTNTHLDSRIEGFSDCSEEDIEDENDTERWNPVVVVRFSAYSQDEGLQLRRVKDGPFDEPATA